MTEVDRAYIAGLFDGEGSVSFVFKKAKNGKRYGKLYARISNTDRKVLEWIKETLGFGFIVSTKMPKPNCKPCYDFVVAYEKARKFLAIVQPYLKIKAGSVDNKLELDVLNVARREKA